MRLPALLLPQTALRVSVFSLLWPLFEPVVVLEPSGVSAPAPASPLIKAGLVEVARPPAGPPAAGSPQAAQLDRLVGQWEAWAAQHRGSERAEALKAGLKLPESQDESLGQLMSEIRRPGQKVGASLRDAPPEVAGDLFLRLMHLQDQEAAEMEDLLSRVKFGERLLGQSMGLDEADTPPADYEEPFARKLPPLEHDLPSDQQLERRLRAWVGLARRAGQDDAWLATANLPAVQALLEAANQRLRLDSPERRSPAGASAPLPDATAGQPPDPASPLAQEAARLVLPDLGHLDEDELVELGQALVREGVLIQMRQGLKNMLDRLAGAPWSAELQKDLVGGCRMLAESLAGHVLAAGFTPGPASRGLSILAFPGLRRQQVLGLLAGEQVAGLPRRQDWPQAWPAGSCPLIALW